MFSNEEWSSLITKLRHLTESGKVNWKPMGESGLIVDVGSGQYTITDRDSDGQPPWVFKVYSKGESKNDPARAVDSIESEYTAENVLYPATLIPGLRDIAFRMSLGGPQLARELLADMNEIDPSAPPQYGDDTPF